jgi:chemotaxis protein methyltransferase CheR
MLAPSGAGPRLSPETFHALRDVVNVASGIYVTDDARFIVERRLAPRLAALRLPTFEHYHEYLNNAADRVAELDRAVDLLTTNETYLFRELRQLKAFQSEVLPQLHALALQRRSLTIWSAGCSTGEEVYTLAMLIDETGLFNGWNVRVFGNDISRRVLHTARRGTYRDASFRAIPPEYARYFTQTAEGRTVVPKIRAMCHFGHFSLFDAARVAILGMVDAIFCRNVLIYFDKESRRRLIQTFHERLYPGGYLMLGHSESLLNVSTAFELAHLKGDLVYRKTLSRPKPNEGGQP